MKKLLSILTSIAFTTQAFAQQTDKALARVKYTFTHVIDTTKKDQPTVENMLLVVGKNASVYTSFDKLTASLNMQKQLQEQVKNQAGGGSMTLTLKSEKKGPVTETDYFYFAKEQKVFTKERVYNNYLIEEEAPEINWKITKDTTSFSDIACQKATTNFRGREWVAWFAPSIPFQSGPWKLNGLPGLIISAHDVKNEVKFDFNGLENVVASTNAKAEESGLTVNGISMNLGFAGVEGSSPYLGAEITLPKNAIKTTKKELDKLKAAKEKDPKGFMQAQMAANGLQGTFNASTTAPTVNPNKAKLNNPIELAEQ